MFRCLIVLIVAFPLPVLAQLGAPEPVPSKAVLRYIAAVDKLRAEKLAELDAQLAVAQAGSAVNKPQQIALLEKKIRNVRHPRTVFRPSMPPVPTDQHTGAVGELDARNFTVVKIFSGEQMLVTFKWKNKAGVERDGTAVLKGYPTKGLLPEKGFDVAGVFEYAGRDERRDRAAIFVLVDQRAIDAQFTKQRVAFDEREKAKKAAAKAAASSTPPASPAKTAAAQ